MRQNIRHGFSVRPEYKRLYEVWKTMRKRCKSENATSYEYYGGRGIDVCEEWNDFSKFLADMGDAPKGMSIDRIDNTKGYCKENCRWATPTQQQRNTTRNRLFTHAGRTMCLVEWAQELGVHYTTIHYRLKDGWSIDRALTTRRKP